MNNVDSSPSPLPAEAASRAELAATLVTPSGAGPRRVFFAGKGGVGKTTAACATAVWTADHGYRTLLVTTDPAAHIGAVLDVVVGDQIGPIAGVPLLDAYQIDAKAVTERYEAEVLDDARRRFDAATVARIAEELASPCTEEIAVFQHFLDTLLSAQYDVVVFDTAPTGHTLRLLALPLDYRDQLAAKAHISDESSAVDTAQAARMGAALDVLRDATRATMALVLYPEMTPIAEAQRAARDLTALGIATQLVIANQILPSAACTNAFFQRRGAMQRDHLRRLPAVFPTAVIQTMLLQAEDVRGLAMLRAISRHTFGE